MSVESILEDILKELQWHGQLLRAKGRSESAGRKERKSSRSLCSIVQWHKTSEPKPSGRDELDEYLRALVAELADGIKRTFGAVVRCGKILKEIFDA